MTCGLASGRSASRRLYRSRSGFYRTGGRLLEDRRRPRDAPVVLTVRTEVRPFPRPVVISEHGLWRVAPWAFDVGRNGALGNSHATSLVNAYRARCLELHTLALDQSHPLHVVGEPPEAGVAPPRVGSLRGRRRCRDS